MAGLARRKRRACRSDRQRYWADQIKSAEPAADSERMEPGRDRPDGVAAVSSPLSILRAGWRIKLPALPTQRRSFSGRAIQHRLLRAAHNDGGTSGRSYAG